MTGEDMVRILCEVCLKTKPARQDTPEEREFRAKLEVEVAEIVKRGHIVEIPNE